MGDMEGYSEIGEILKRMCDRKKLSMTELGRRCGVKSVRPLLMRKGMDVGTLQTLCDKMGVELCIIDGWRKHRLNKFRCMREVDLFFDSMVESVGEKDGRDRWLTEQDLRVEKVVEQGRKYREKDRKKYNEYTNEYTIGKRIKEKGDLCLSCEYCEEKMEQEAVNGVKHFCRCYGEYKRGRKCKWYKQKDPQE